MSSQPLSLVAFAPPTVTRGLTSTLTALGHLPVVITPAAWFNAEKPAFLQKPILIYLGERDYPSETICSTLRARHSSAIAIFDRGVAILSPDVAASCSDFISWPCAEQELVIRIERIQAAAQIRQPKADEAEILNDFADLNLLGRSSAFVKALRLIKRIARCDETVLIEGETGTGKELAARAIHYLGARKNHPFIPVNCGAIPENLVESELFGHERGAFTDAKSSLPGLIAQAEGGTIFLDEVETLSSKAQAAILRFLQDKEYRPLGSRRAHHANVRIITASNVQLEKLVEGKQFRQDLLFRLKIMTVTLPPLRERDGDVEFLAEHFLNAYRSKYGVGVFTFDAQARDWMRTYSWPGNVRELENLLLREFLLAEGPALHLGTRKQEINSERRNQAVDRRANQWLSYSLSGAKTKLIAEFERAFLSQLLADTGGNISEAARRAGKERRAFGKLIKKYGISKINP